MLTTGHLTRFGRQHIARHASQAGDDASPCSNGHHTSHQVACPSCRHGQLILPLEGGIVLRAFPFSSSPAPVVLPRPDTLGAEKESGVPYILTSYRRHRQTPLPKHDQKTRHVGLAHVAQPSYRALVLTLAKFSVKRQYAVAYVLGAFRACPAPRLLEAAR